MHYIISVLVPKEMPHRDTAEALLKDHEGEHWDWFQFGARGTGWYDGFNPRTEYPEGTWPTEFPLRDEDIAPSSVAAKRKHSAIVTPDGVWHDREEEGFEDLFGKHEDCVSVIVDCHN